MNATIQSIESAWEDRSLLSDPLVKANIHQVIAQLDSGKLRVCEKQGEEWIVHEWIKKAILLYFLIVILL